jgi:putative Mg2+ transporter-C (MgtC) family protein
MDISVVDLQGLLAIVGRLFLAAVLGALIGLEREASGKPAGFRTNLLICLGAALITELSINVARDGTLPNGLRADPGRIAAQIVSGIGFLGAGTILKTQGHIIGLTTAATMWVVAGIGMAVGGGFYVLALAGALITFLALRFLGRLDDRVLPARWDRQTVTIEVPRARALEDVEASLQKLGLEVELLQVERQPERTIMAFVTTGRTRTMIASDLLRVEPDILKVTVR